MSRRRVTPSALTGVAALWPMSSAHGALGTRPRRRRRLVLVVLPAVLAAWLATSGLALPAPSVRHVLEARTLQLTNGELGAGWSHAMRTDIPTELVGFDWDGTTEGAVELRARDAGQWGPWTRIEGNPAEAPDSSSHEFHNRTAAGPAWVGSGVRDIEFRVVEGSLPHLRVHTIRSEQSGGSQPSISAASADPVPGIISRAGWGANESYRNQASG